MIDELAAAIAALIEAELAPLRRALTRDEPELLLPLDTAAAWAHRDGARE